MVAPVPALVRRVDGDIRECPTNVCRRRLTAVQYARLEAAFDRKVLQRDNIKNTYFILMSAKRDMDWILAAKKAGADGLITKPFTPETLKQKISQLVATHALA
jgi:CheY-like chemotaxis protein